MPVFNSPSEGEPHKFQHKLERQHRHLHHENRLIKMGL